MASQNKIDLEKSLNAVENSRNLSDVHNQTSKLVTEGIIEKSSLDGKKIDQKIDGFISKTDNPNIKEDVDGSEPIFWISEGQDDLGRGKCFLDLFPV